MGALLIKVFRDNYRYLVSKIVVNEGRTGLRFVYHVLRHVCMFAFAVVISPFIVIALTLFSLCIRIRIGLLRSGRIGHLAHNTDLFLRRKKLGKRGFYIMLSPKPANRQLSTMIKRQICVLEHPFFLLLYEVTRSYSTSSNIWIELPPDYNAFKEFNAIPPQLSFNAHEKEKGAKELSRMGIRPGVSYVCFHARDSAYLSKIQPYPGWDWSYHDYRDSDIDNYLPAAEYLVKQGLFAIRMGYVVKKTINISNPRIIDYASRHRSDFMDVYLLGHCRFFLGDNAGLQCVTRAFGIPVAAANWIPIKYSLLCKHDLFIPKKLWSIEKKRFLTFREIFRSGIDSWIRAELYARAGIEVVENTPDEILCLAKEMEGRLRGTWVAADEDEYLQECYRSLLPIGHCSYGFSSRIGAEFLRQNRELLNDSGKS